MTHKYAAWNQISLLHFIHVNAVMCNGDSLISGLLQRLEIRSESYCLKHSCTMLRTAKVMAALKICLIAAMPYPVFVRRTHVQFVDVESVTPTSIIAVFRMRLELRHFLDRVIAD